MKKLAFLMILALGLGSCSLFNIDVDTNVDGLLRIDVEEGMAKGTAERTHFRDFVSITPDSDEINDYRDRINEVGINNVTATVASVSKEDVVIYQDSKVIISVDGKKDAEYILEKDWPIEEDNTFPLYDQEDFYSEIAAILEDLETFEITMDGYSSQSGVLITIKFNIEAKISGSIF